VEVPGSTLSGIEGVEPGRAVWGRRIVLALLAVFVLVGLSGYLGVHTSTASAEQDGYHLSLRYASVARSGLDVPFEATVTSDHGFSDTITLALIGDYLDIFETQGFIPDPSSAVRNGDTLYLTFDSPGGNTFRFSYDAYIQPASQQGRRGTLGIVTDDQRTVAAVSFRTRLLP
jgi:hypothetical protein